MYYSMPATPHIPPPSDLTNSAASPNWSGMGGGGARWGVGGDRAVVELQKVPIGEWIQSLNQYGLSFKPVSGECPPTDGNWHAAFRFSSAANPDLFLLDLELTFEQCCDSRPILTGSGIDFLVVSYDCRPFWPDPKPTFKSVRIRQNTWESNIFLKN